ncbi:hypothetical protein Anas_14437 [Armadillidium nasatum]|uniref:Uncharacterized protein n=1 Tax=Armadillidium nasatum TaxID=96803 RepID=A0A5N5T5P3_9CRUS|nr:hypothetical protein Anas_14437 [Armadillidium nasatum]
MKYIILVVLSSAFLNLVLSQTQINQDICTVDISNMTVEQLANDPPPGITTGCFDKNLITKVLSSKEHVLGVMECLHPEYPVCNKRGYRFIAEEIYRRSSNAGQCRDCTERENELALFTMKLLQKNYPRELRLGLSYIG